MITRFRIEASDKSKSDVQDEISMRSFQFMHQCTQGSVGQMEKLWRITDDVISFNKQTKNYDARRVYVYRGAENE